MVKDWRDWPDESTPIVAAELERMETDTASAAAAAGAATSAVAGFTGRVGQAEDRIAATESEVAALQSGKSDTGHLHEVGDVTGLQAALDGKSPTGHTHHGSDITSGVVKTVNSSAPDGAGNVSIPSIVASTAADQLLVGDGNGGWKVWTGQWQNISWWQLTNVTQPVPVQYRFEPGGVVRFRGQVTGADPYQSSTLMLPPLLRPSATRTFAAMLKDGAIRQVDITNAGVISWTNAQVYFDPICYSL